MPPSLPDDPPPQPPQRPDERECCGNGCEPCIFDLFADEEERYRAALRAWQERHAGSAKGGTTPEKTRT